MMDRGLNKNEIQYLMDHLAPLYSGAKLQDFLVTDKSALNEDKSGCASFYIPGSVYPLKIKEVSRIGEMPVLFPCSTTNEWYTVEGNLIRFHHDILKSAFYLLSGYQEYVNKDLDAHGRFPWESSIQFKLGITHKPVVNYYFEVILEAFEKFCRLNELDFKKRERAAPLLFLSHDVDRIKKYTLRNLTISILQLVGIKKGSSGFSRQLKIVSDYSKGIVLFRKNPYWIFQKMIDLEQELKITSTWFFLEKTKQDNSRYHFSQKKIRDLIAHLSKRGHEIGIHGTLESSTEQQAMEGGVKRLNAVCKRPVSGIRQHFLKYNLLVTPRIQSVAGLDYDASLGFAEQPGFRNSYAYPFRLYDFDNQETMDIWQLPLNVMETTLIDYMGVPVDDFPETIQPVLEEVVRFNGLFSLLWHNCRLDEEWNPGINIIYRQLLKKIMQSGFVSVTGRKAVDEFISGGASGSSL